MADIALRDAGTGARQHALDVVFRSATWVFAVFVLLILTGVIVSLVAGALPALEHFGWRFII